MMRAAFGACSLVLSVLLSAGGVTAQETHRGILSLTFDDANRTQLELGLPKAEEVGIRGTLYVATLLTMLASTHTDYGWLMTWDEIKRFRDAGWEIGAHSRSHSELARIPPSYLDWEMSGSNHDIEVNLGVTPTTMAAPFGSYNGKVVMAAKKFYKGLVTTDDGVNDRQRFNPFAIRRVDVGKDASAAEICGKIQSVAADGNWLVLTVHGITKGQAGDYEVSQSVYDEIMDCAARARDDGTLKILPVAEALQELRPAG